MTVILCWKIFLISPETEVRFKAEGNPRTERKKRVIRLHLDGIELAFVVIMCFVYE